MIRPITFLAALSLLCVAPAVSQAYGSYGSHQNSCSDKSRNHYSGRDCKPVYTGKHQGNCGDKSKNHRDGKDCKPPYTGKHNSNCTDKSKNHRDGKYCKLPPKNHHTSNCYDKTKNHHGGKDCKPKNRPPCAIDDCTITVDANKSIVINVLANDYDANGDKLTITKVSKPSHGTAVIQNNKITYTPAKNYSGSDSFTYTITDGKGACASAKVCIKAKSVPPPPPPVKNPPKAQDDCTIEVVLDTPIVIDVLDNDLPADSTFTITNFTQPKNGTVVRNSDDTFTYTPKSGYVGTDSFTYTIANGAMCSDKPKGYCGPVKQVLCTSTAKVCLEVKGTPPPTTPDCAGILLFGPDAYLTDYLQDYLEANNFPGDVYVYKTGNDYIPGEFTTAINEYKALNNGALPCATLVDTEYVGPNEIWSGLDAADAQTLKNLILGGMGFVYAEPTDLGGATFGQFPTVLPLVPHTFFDKDLWFDIVSPTSPIVDALPGLSLNPYGTGYQSFYADSSGQDEGIFIDLLNPVAGVRYDNVVTVLQGSTSSGNSYLPGLGLGTGYTLDYQPAGGPTPTQPGGRVVVLGTDPYPDYNGNLSPTIQKLYFNSLKYAAGY